jgi:hypothetical protein
MGKKLKKILPIAAVLVPFAAPAIVAGIAGSSAVSGIAGGAVSAALKGTVGKTVASAVVGGALSKATGGSFTQGAVTGGVAGYSGIGVPKAAGAAQGATNVAAGTAATNAAGSVASNVAAQGNTIMGMITRAGGQIAQGLTDPGMWGRAAMYLAAGTLGQVTEKPDPALQAYIDELRRVSASNSSIQQAAFNVGNQLVAEARSISPAGEGLRAATEAKQQVIAAGQQAMEATPVRNVGQRAALERQYYTDAARIGAGAYTGGFAAGRTARQAGLQNAYAGVPLLNAQGGTAAQLSMQQGQNEGQRVAGILEGLQYITTPQKPSGQGATGMQKVNLHAVGTPPIVPPGSVTPEPASALTGVAGLRNNNYVT